MIHLPTAAGGRVEHLGRPGRVVLRGEVIARVHPEEGPLEEVIAPFDALVALQRLHGTVAPRYAKIVGLRRVLVSTCPGRVRWIATLGPVGVESMLALVEHEGALRPHRAGANGFVGEIFTRPGARVETGDPLVEIRGEELG